MDKSTEILNELKTISPALAAIEKVNVFQIPDNYFIDLDKRIWTAVFLHPDEKNNSQKVPEGYFENLSNTILSRIKNENIDNATEEIRQISPALFYLKEENVFTVPENYFENLSEEILDKINHKKSKIVSINSYQKWWKYAAAAVVAGAIAIFSLQTFNNTSSTNDNKETITASANIPDYIRLSSQYKTPEQLDEGIASLSDDEIVKYLEKHGSILDDETLTKNTDVKGLPEPADYLMDENTLSNFLNEIDSGSTNINTR